MVPALLGLVFAFVPRRKPTYALLSLNLWALMIVVGIWFGDIRLRVVYDPVIIVLAMLVYAEAWLWMRARLAKRRSKDA
jgi:hypothetical protein